MDKKPATDIGYNRVSFARAVRNPRSLLAFNSSRYRLWRENAAFAAAVPDGALVLDAGAGNAPYRQLFQHARYETADFEKADTKYAPSTYVCDLGKIPVENCRFDFIVFNQVMEHLPEPKQVLSEFHRILKPNGKMIYTGPLFYEEHMKPYDYYRYTQFGLRYLFSSTGFVIDRIDWLEGYFGTVAYQFRNMARYLPYRPGDIGGGLYAYLMAPMMAVLKVVLLANSVFFHMLETHFKYQRRGYPKNYVALLRKTSTGKGD